jgi:stress response protein YsnF
MDQCNLPEDQSGRAQSVRSEHVARGEDVVSARSTDVRSESDSIVVPVVEEELAVGKRVVEEGGIRVTRRVEEHEEIIRQALRRENVEVVRVPVNRVVKGAEPVRQEGDVIVVPMVEEVLVVTKQLVVREELHIRKRVREEVDPQRVVLRKQVVDVEKLQSSDTPGEGGTNVAKRSGPAV